METLESFIRRRARTARERHDTATVELIHRLEQAHRITSERLHAAVYSQALHVWWDMVQTQVDKHGLDAEKAIGLVRRRTTRYLTCEPDGTKPGTLFDHALAHVSRAAARRFLTATDTALAARQPEEAGR